MGNFLVRYRWMLLGFSFLLALYFFIPHVWLIQSGSDIQYRQQSKKQGERITTVGPSTKEWVPFKKISKNTLNAVITSEDSRFYEHEGLDWEEISKSLEKNLSKKRYARGASTITQQVVKMAFLSREKTLLRKSREAVGALLLEKLVPKTTILEWYLNLAEFGDGVYGIKKASQHYFQTKPELLTIQQGIHLALVLPSPNGWSVGLRRKDLTNFGQKRFEVIAEQMRKNSMITESQWLNVLATGNFGRPLLAYERYANRQQTALPSIENVAVPLEPGIEEVSAEKEAEKP